MAKIKICGITSQREAEILNEVHADFAGFVLFYPKSKRNISVQKANEIFQVLDKSIRKVAVVVSPSKKEIMQIEQGGFDFIQIHGELTKEILQSVHLPILKAFNGKDAGQYSKYQAEDKITGYVFDAAEPGSGRTFDWELLRLVFREGGMPKAQKMFILAGGLHPQNVASALRSLKPDVVDVSSGVEYTDGSPGKDPQRIREFVKAVKGE